MFYPDEVNCVADNKSVEKIAFAEYSLENDKNMCTQKEMERNIQELDFAIIDLNLFLDTHPDCIEAIELFAKLCATSKSLKKDYQYKYGPLYVDKTPGVTPFEWVDKCRKWPWE